MLKKKTNFKCKTKENPQELNYFTALSYVLEQKLSFRLGESQPYIFWTKCHKRKFCQHPLGCNSRIEWVDCLTP